MKKLLPIISFLSSLSCLGQTPNNKNSFVLTGKIIGRDTGLIVLLRTDTLDKWIKDTSVLQKGKFQFSGWMKEPSYAHLIGSNRDGNYASFYLGKGRQTIILKENNFDNLKMTGSSTQKEVEPLQKQSTELEKKRNQLSEKYNSKEGVPEERKKQLENQIQLLVKKERQLSITFIKKHPDSYAAPTELLSLINYISLNLADSLFTAFTERIKSTKSALLCKQEIEKKKQLKAGVTLPHFSTKDINGLNISISQLKGKYVLLDFWASWCIPCREAIPHLKEVFSTYSNKEFEIVSISTDKKKEKWEKAVHDEKIENWINLLQNAEIENIFQGVTILPTQILLDPQGKIIWSSLEDNQNSWEDLLKENLKLHQTQ